MTVCIAAVCNMGPDRPTAIIAASDRMITIDGIEYEPEQTKMCALASSTVALLAGDMQLHALVVPKVIRRLRDELDDDAKRDIKVHDIARFYAEEFMYHRRLEVERVILEPRGLNFDRFLTRQATMAHHQVEKIDNDIMTYYIDASAIITGSDSTGAHIYRITNPGKLECMDTPYFDCIGSGERLASVQFMLARYDKRWPATNALFLTYSAKARAEATTGVGSSTDIAVITPGSIRWLSDQEKTILQELFLKMRASEQKEQDACYQAVDSYVRSMEETGGTKNQQQTELNGAGQPDPDAASDSAVISSAPASSEDGERPS